MPEEFPWPPPFAVRVSKRAKHARLRVLPDAGLEVVLPQGIAHKTATDIVERHKEWICKTLRRVCGGLPEQPDATAALPERIALHGGERDIPVLYGQPESSFSEQGLCLRAGAGRAEAAAELQQWARRYAADNLGQETASLAAEFGLPYATLRFRRQKSRWGSCTSRGDLSLNTCLVFLPSRLARHVILHELAHTRHMDHGQEFWKTLFAMEPDALALDKRLRTAWRFVPAWIWR